jgi:ribosome biogenesis GTPase
MDARDVAGRSARRTRPSHPQSNADDGRMEMMMTRIEQFGWRGPVEPGIGRIVSSHGDYYHLVCNEAEGEILARKKKSAFRTEGALRPLTGDFVRFRHNTQGESLILDVLPRRSWFERKDPTARRKAQTLAVNFDTLFIMMSLNEDFSTARIERYLDLAQDCGEADVAVVVTKMDLREEGDEAFLDDLTETVAGRAHILQISSLSGEGLAEVRRFVRPCRTLAFIGSSGVGKSTLVNTLAGEEWMPTQEIQSWSGKGRHTTTSRELVRLSCGAMVIDTPGIREIGRVGEEDAVLLRGESTHRYRK